MPKRDHIPAASSFLLSRIVNALLVLGQLALVARLYGNLDASKFFVLWTVIWAGSVGVRFGFDLLLPKHVASAELSGSVGDLAGYRRVARYTLPAVVVLSGPVLIAVLPDTSPAEALLAIPIVVVGAIGWALPYLASALARGYGHAGLSGWIGGPVAILLATGAVPAAHAISDSWLVLGVASALALALSAAIALTLLARAIAWRRVSAALFNRPTGAVDPDTWSTGALMAIAEINLVLPVWIAGGLGLSAVEVGALYGALRMAAAFSWLFTTVVTVITPMLAEALARRNYTRLRELLWRSAMLGAGATIPLAAVGALLSAQLLGLLDPSYRDYGYLLAILIGARLLDAATGAVAEALIIGDRARWELVNQVVATAFLLLAAILLEPSMGVGGLALAVALSVAVLNLARVVEVRRLLAGAWRAPASTMEAP
jgi:O-antigen/teichoic acid export membrane protein